MKLRIEATEEEVGCIELILSDGRKFSIREKKVDNIPFLHIAACSISSQLSIEPEVANVVNIRDVGSER